LLLVFLALVGGWDICFISRNPAWFGMRLAEWLPGVTIEASRPALIEKVRDSSR